VHAANVDKYGVSFFTLLQSVGSVASIKHGGEDHACCGHLEVTAINFHLQLTEKAGLGVGELESAGTWIHLRLFVAENLRTTKT